MTKTKKESKLSLKNKAEKTKELELNISNAIEESKKCQEKIVKLAAQFDKELVDRDKSYKKAQTTLWDDIQSLFTQHQADVTELAKQVTDLQVKKCDKKDLTQS